MKKNSIFWLLAGVLLLTAAVASFHLATRTEVPRGQLLVTYDGRETKVSVSELDLQKVQGTISNAKGDKRTIDARGVSVSDVLTEAEVSECSVVAVVAEDEYRAELTAEEAFAAEGVYFILQEDGSLQLIVFSDSNSKRNVSNAVRLEVS